MSLLSVIVPAYNEEAMVPLAAKEISRILSDASIDYEIIFVDDGSSDGTWSAIERVSQPADNERISGLKFSRNFGKEAAIFAGLSDASGDCCVVLDCDLQHPPEKIVEMFDLWKQGFEVIEGKKSDRGQEGKAHRAFANLFYKLVSRASKIEMEDSSDFKLLDRRAVNAICAMPERGIFFRALSFWVGFKRAEIFYDVRERTEGESKWGGGALVSYALNNIASFSAAPMQIVTVLGIIAFVISVVFSVISLVQWIMGSAIGGFTTVILLLLFMSSLIMISLGLCGYYIARIYEEVKGRPRFILSETVCRPER